MHRGRLLHTSLVVGLAGLVTGLALRPGTAGAQAPAGVVTTLTGRALVARAALPRDPVPLRFRDPVFVRDRVDTLESAVVRLLLGGKALITVRELSSFTITEEVGRARVDLQRGKVSLGVVSRRLSPGEVIELQTPNAIAAVRGTVAVAEVIRATAQAGDAGPVPATTTFYVLKGSLAVRVRPPQVAAVSTTALQLPGLIVLSAFQSLSVIGTVPGPIRPFTLADLAGILAGLSAGLQHTGAPDETRDDVNTNQMQQGTGLAGTLAGGGDLGGGPPPPPTPPPPPPTPEILPTTGETIGGSGAATANGDFPTGTVVNDMFVNGGFEQGVSGWTRNDGGRASTLSQFGSIEPAQGSKFAIVHTQNATFLSSSCATDAACRRSELRQSFRFDAGNPHVKFRLWLLSNEFPTFTGSQSVFNDKVRVELWGSESLVDSLIRQVNQFDPGLEGADPVFQALSTSNTTNSGFTLASGGGYVDLGYLMLLGSGIGDDETATLKFIIEDISDGAKPSAILIDDVQWFTDPPLFVVRNGEHFAGPDGAPLVRRVSTTETSDSILMVCCGGVVTLSGPLLQAGASVLTATYRLAQVFDGGRVVSTWAGPLVKLDGGSYALGTASGMLEIGGLAHAIDPLTGLDLGTDQPLRHPGTLLEADGGAAVTTRSLVKVDTALLEASAPLLHLRGGADMQVAGDLVDLSYRARVTSLGSLVRLDGSTLTVAGALVNVNGGVLSGSGSLLNLANGSTLTAGLLGSVSNGGRFAWSGPLATFTGAGNTITLTNALCGGADCVTAGGLRFALQNGARAANVSVTNPTPFVGAGGTVNAPGSAAHFVLSGPTSAITLAP